MQSTKVAKVARNPQTAPQIALINAESPSVALRLGASSAPHNRLLFMPLAFHADHDAKYEHQVQNARTYIVPFVERARAVQDIDVLEIGCGEGGVLHSFAERGASCVGVDLASNKIAAADRLAREAGHEDRLTFLDADIYDEAVQSRLGGRFDLVILKDTIEHIHGQDRLLEAIQSYLKPDGLLFIAFPPWFMPFGGHQQVADTRLGKLPYLHLLPQRAYRRLLEAFGESPERIRVLMEIYDTRLSLQQFAAIARHTGYREIARELYLINPIYRYKFGLKPVRQLPIVRSIPWLRDFVTTTCYILLARS